MCSPVSEGGLGLRSIRPINEAAMLKLGWNLISSTDHWASFLRARFLRNLRPMNHCVSSSIWPSMRKWFIIVMRNVSWQIGNGKRVNFWTDKWSAATVVNLLRILAHLHQSLRASVAGFIIDSL